MTTFLGIALAVVGATVVLVLVIIRWVILPWLDTQMVSLRKDNTRLQEQNARLQDEVSRLHGGSLYCS